MIFYHFTSHANAESILREGITRGEVPLDAHRVLEGVNLTTAPTPVGHGLDKGGHVVTADEARAYGRAGLNIPAGSIFADKMETRLKIKLVSSDRRLQRWLPWARKHVEPAFLPELIQAGGGLRCAKSWWIYWGTVEPASIIDRTDLKSPSLLANS